MTALKARPLRRAHLRLVENETIPVDTSLRTPAGQVRIPGLRPAGWVCARAQVAGQAPLSPREAELVTHLLLRDGRWTPAYLLSATLFGPGSSSRLVLNVVCRARAKLGRAVIESSYAAGYRIPGRYRPGIPTCCTRCGSPVEWEGREWTCTDCGRSGELPRLEVVDRGVGRRGYEEGTRQGSPWSEEEKRFVLEHLDDMSLDELGDAVDRTASAVRGFLATNGLRKPYVRARRGRGEGGGNRG